MKPKRLVNLHHALRGCAPPSVRRSVTPSLERLRDASNAVYPALFFYFYSEKETLREGVVFPAFLPFPPPLSHLARFASFDPWFCFGRFPD